MCCSLVNWRTKETEAFYFAVNLDSFQVVCFDNVISPNSSSVGAVFAITDCSYKSVIHFGKFSTPQFFQIKFDNFLTPEENLHDKWKISCIKKKFIFIPTQCSVRNITK